MNILKTTAKTNLLIGEHSINYPFPFVDKKVQGRQGIKYGV